MNKKFNFRGWDKKFKNWVPTMYWFLDPIGEPRWQNDSSVARNIIVQQCTGLKDKNGKYIYEGDLVDYWGDDGFYRVVFCHGKFYMEREDEIGIADFDYSEKQRNVKIVGNIFEKDKIK